MGEYDVEVLLAEACHWTPQQIYEQDADFIEQLVAKLSANGKYKPEAGGGGAATSSKGPRGTSQVGPDPDYD